MKNKIANFIQNLNNKMIDKLIDEEEFNKIMQFDEIEFFGYFAPRLILQKHGEKKYDKDLFAAQKVMRVKNWSPVYLVEKHSEFRTKQKINKETTPL